MLKARKSILVMICALCVLASFGIAAAQDQIDGLTSSQITDNYVNPGGLGDTLIYPYYNGANGMQTYFTVVNTSTTNGQRVRVRFRESANVPDSLCTTTKTPVAAGSWEVLDFDLCLTAGDEWSGWVTGAPGGGAMLCSFDTDTLIWDGNVSELFPSACVPFKYGTQNTNSGVTAADTTEGYFEIIGEDQLTKGPYKTCNPLGDSSISPFPNSPDCDQAPAYNGTTTTCLGYIGPFDDEISPYDVPNVLFGNWALIDGVTTGAWTGDATAISFFAEDNIRQSPTTSEPTLGSGIDSLFGVNFILTKDQLYTVYDLINSQSEIVITAPTKLLSQQADVEDEDCDDISSDAQLEDNQFYDTSSSFTAWNDAEVPTVSICDFSPCTVPVNTLPYEVNVLQLNDTATGQISDILVSNVSQVVDIPFDFGWFNVNLEQNPLSPDWLGADNHYTCYENHNAETLYDDEEICQIGWPVIGFSMIDVGNGGATGAFPLQYKTRTCYEDGCDFLFDF